MKKLVKNNERRHRNAGYIFAIFILWLLVSFILLETYPSPVTALLMLASFAWLLPALILDKLPYKGLSLREEILVRLDGLVHDIADYNAYANKERRMSGRKLRAECRAIMFRLGEGHSPKDDDLFSGDYWAFVDDMRIVLETIREGIRRGENLPTAVAPQLANVVSLGEKLADRYTGDAIEAFLREVMEKLEVAGIEMPPPKEPLREWLQRRLREWWSVGGMVSVGVFSVTTVIWGLLTWPLLWPEEKGAYLMGFLMIFLGTMALYFAIRGRPSKSSQK